MTPMEMHRVAVRKRLLELEQDGRLTADRVVDDARDPASPLHSEFEWDVEKAAMAAWLERARVLIRSVIYEHHVETRSYSVPRYLRDPEMGSEEQGYITVPRIRSEPDLARRALSNELTRAAAMLRRAAAYGHALNLQDEMAGILTAVEGLLERIGSEGQNEEAAA